MSLQAAFFRIPEITSDIRRLFQRSLITATASLDFPSTAAGAASDLTITVSGAEVNDTVLLGLPVAPLATFDYIAFVSAPNTVAVRAVNRTAGALDPAAATYRVTVLKA